MLNLIIKFEKWKFNKEYGVWVSTEGKVKDRYKRILPTRMSKDGYCAVQTEKGFKNIHRLVMLTFFPIANSEKLTIDHLNHNKRDNSVKNLEWVTREENWKRARRDILNCTQNKDTEEPKVQYSEDEKWYIVNGVYMSELHLIDFIRYNRNVSQSCIVGNLKRIEDKEISYCGLLIKRVYNEKENDK